jgi:DNA-binding NtrC family response regulator
MSEDSSIDVETLSPILGTDLSAPAEQPLLCDAPFDVQVRDFKRRLIQAALHENGGNKTRAAEHLGITRAYLHRILRQEPEMESREDDEPDRKQRAS